MNIFDRFKLLNLKTAGGDETHRFEAILAMVKSDGTIQKLAIASNGGRGGSNMYYPLEPITSTWLREKLEPAVQQGLIAFYRDNPDQCHPEMTVDQTVELLKGSRECTDWLVSEMINTHALEQLRLRTQLRTQFDNQPTNRRGRIRRPTSDFSIGDKVKFGRRNGEKTLGKVVKVNKKSLKVEILEDRGSRSKAGEVWRVPPSLCTVVP